MFKFLLERADRIGRERARAVSARIAEQMRTDLPVGIRVEAIEEGVGLSGPGIVTRFALEPALRRLMAMVR